MPELHAFFLDRVGMARQKWFTIMEVELVVNDRNELDFQIMKGYGNYMTYPPRFLAEDTMDTHPTLASSYFNTRLVVAEKYFAAVPRRHHRIVATVPQFADERVHGYLYTTWRDEKDEFFFPPGYGIVREKEIRRLWKAIGTDGRHNHGLTKTIASLAKAMIAEPRAAKEILIENVTKAMVNQPGLREAVKRAVDETLGENTDLSEDETPKRVRIHAEPPPLPTTDEDVLELV